MDTKKILNYFISGLLFLIPVFVVIQLIKGVSWFVTTFVSLPLLIAFPLACIGILLVGYVIQNFLRKKIKKQIHTYAKNKTPLGYIAKIITKFDMLSDHVHKAFHNPVLYKVDDGIYKLGFITNESMVILEDSSTPKKTSSEAKPEEGSIWIYAPYPVNFSGELVLVEQRKIKRIKKEEKESIPLFALSAGILK